MTTGHLDPFQRGESPTCASSLPQTCQVGDLAGKHGTITSDPFSATYVDEFASTLSSSASYFGNLSVVVHFANKTRITCGNFAAVGGGNGTLSAGNSTVGAGNGTASGGGMAGNGTVSGGGNRTATGTPMATLKVTPTPTAMATATSTPSSTSTAQGLGSQSTNSAAGRGGFGMETVGLVALLGALGAGVLF